MALEPHQGAGGGYDARCGFGKQSGRWTFVSERDPGLASTLSVYDGTAAFLRTAPLDDGELVRNIIGALRSTQAARSPAAKARLSLSRFLSKTSEEALQREREEILSTAPRHFRDFADVLEAARAQARVVIMASPEALAKAARETGMAIHVTPVS